MCRRLSAVTGNSLAPQTKYDDAVAAAVAEFQYLRGLYADGVCSTETWNRLVEASYHLGDRLLYLRSPMLRGDDVAELQARLGSLGFDAGRVDGIFGENTAAGVMEFQQNVGLVADGRCGRRTLEELGRLRTSNDLSAVIAGLRERDALRRGSPGLPDANVVLAHPGGLGALLDTIRRSLADHGANVIILDHPHNTRLALEANAAHAVTFLHFAALPDQAGCSTAYYAGYRWESPAGRWLAEELSGRLGSSLSIPNLGSQGMSLPLLRETRMPAVMCHIGPTATVVQRASEIAQVVTSILQEWLGGQNT